MTIQYDPQKVTDWLTPLEKVYARQSQQLDLYHQQLRERDRQEEAAVLNVPEMFSKLASFSSSIASVVEARETGQKTKASGEEQKLRRKLSGEDLKKRNEIQSKYELDKKGLIKDSEGFEKAVKDSGLLDKYSKEELFGSSPKMTLLRREVSITRQADSIDIKFKEALKDPKWNRKWSETEGNASQREALREDIIDEITATWDTSEGLYYSGVEKKLTDYLKTKVSTDKLKLREIQATKKEDDLYGFVNDSVNPETRGVAISTTVKNNTIYADPETPLSERRQAWDSFFLSTDRGIRSGEIKLTQDQLLDTPIKRDDGAIVPLSKFATEEDLKTINEAYNTYNSDIYKNHQAVTKAKIQTAFVTYKQDGDEDARGKALNQYLRNGGKTSDPEYKALENAKKSDPVIAEIETERVGEIQLTGRPGQYEDEVENMSQVDFVKWKKDKEAYEANREQNGFGKTTSDELATNIVKTKMLGFDISIGGKELKPGTQEEIRDFISAKADKIYMKHYQNPEVPRDQIDELTENDLTNWLASKGAGVKADDRENADFGILTSDGQGGFPGWDAQKDSKIERTKGTNTLRTRRNLENELKEHKTVDNLLKNGKGITNAELLAVIDNIQDGKLTAFPPDVLLKARIYGKQPSAVVLSKLEYLESNTKNSADLDFVKRFDLDPKKVKNLKEQLANSPDIQIRKVLEGVNDGRTLLSQFNRQGVESFTPKQLRQMIVGHEHGVLAQQKQAKLEKERLEEEKEIEETKKMQQPDTQIGRYNTRS